MYFHIVTSAFYLPRQNMLKFEGWEINSACDFVKVELSEDNINDSEIDDNRAKLKDNRI